MSFIILFTITSAHPSALVIDDDDLASLRLAPSSSACLPFAALSHSSTSSGEYNIFSLLGSIIAGGWAAKAGVVV